jgi:hypothetical protein
LAKNILKGKRIKFIRFVFFRNGLKKSFLKKKDLVEEKDILQAVEHGRYVYKELEALWFLKK